MFGLGVAAVSYVWGTYSIKDGYDKLDKLKNMREFSQEESHNGVTIKDEPCYISGLLSTPQPIQLQLNEEFQNKHFFNLIAHKRVSKYVSMEWEDRSQVSRTVSQNSLEDNVVNNKASYEKESDKELHVNSRHWRKKYYSLSSTPMMYAPLQIKDVSILADPSVQDDLEIKKIHEEFEPDTTDKDNTLGI